MRIGVVTTSYPRAFGDPAGGFVAELTHWLAGRGHELEVIAAGPGQTRDGEIPILRVPTGASLFYDEGAPDRLERRPANWLWAPVFTLAQAAAAARYARRWDRILAHWILPSGLIAAKLGPTLTVAHSGDVHLAARPLLADAVALALRRGRTAFVAEHLRTRLLAQVRSPRLRAELAARSFVCPMGVDTARLERLRDADRAAAKQRLGLSPNRPIICALGRLVPIKGLEVLCAAAPQEAELVIAGAGPLRERLAVRARLVGELCGAAKDDLFCAADVLVVPSIDQGHRTEGAPLVILEALAAGLPVVASDLPGTRAVASDAALYAPPGDAAALRTAIRQALWGHDRDTRVHRGHAIARTHSWNAIGARLLRELVALPSSLRYARRSECTEARAVTSP